MDRRRPADRRSQRSDSIGSDRGGVLLGRLLGLVLVVCGLALGAVVVAPGFVGSIADDVSGVVSSASPPPTDEHYPDRLDPDDPGETATETGVERVSSETVERLVHEAVNDRRAKRGLDPISWDGTAGSVARAHAAAMHERNFFDHVNPEGEDPGDRYTDVASYCSGYGENIATTRVGDPVERPSDSEVVRHRTAEELATGLVGQWMNSTSHREAVLDDGWDRAGVGVYLADDGAVFAVQNFCRDR